MRAHILNIGEVRVATGPSVFTCYGLGSCIGLFVQDRVAGISGGAHILLPEQEKANTTDGLCYNVQDALERLLGGFKDAGSKLENLRAKVAGGAHVVSTSNNVGERNIQSVVNRLIANRVFIAARDLGGRESRTAHFHSMTGEMKIRTSGVPSYKVY